MEIVFDLWHLAFANLVQERAPPSFIVESGVRLSIEPQRADLLLIRRDDTPRDDNEETKMTQEIEEMPGYDDIFEKLLQDRPPEKRLVGLSPEQQLLAVSDEILRQLPDSYLRTLSPETQSAIRARIGRPD